MFEKLQESVLAQQVEQKVGDRIPSGAAELKQK